MDQGSVEGLHRWDTIVLPDGWLRTNSGWRIVPTPDSETLTIQFRVPANRRFAIDYVHVAVESIPGQPVCTDNDGDTYAVEGGDCGLVDCNDSRGDIHPGAAELCDGVDNDCDGLVDSDDPDVTGMTTYYYDGDSDTYGDPNNTILACAAPPGYVSDNTDCDDTNGSIHPGAQESCDGVDNDCDGLVDGDDPDVTGMTAYYYDGDSDTYGDPNNTILGCAAPPGYVSDNTDCDDTNGSIHPGAQEACDGVDNDCDGLVDGDDPDVTGMTAYYYDGDNDTYGDPNNTILACAAPPGYVSDNTDCDDTNGSIHPGAQEACDGVDNDCDGLVDSDDPDVTGMTAYYYDGDSDMYGDPNNATLGCAAPPGYVSDNTDCDDTNGSIHPGAQESCDGVDNDCDGLVDGDDPDVTGMTAYYYDGDSDTYGDPSNTILACTAPPGYGSDNTDCDDTNGSIHPGAQESCDGVDNDCDGLVDGDDPDVTGMTAYYYDGDSDTYGDPNNTILACAAPPGYVSDNTDCEDDDSDVNPGAEEICDNKDNNCNGLGDECNTPPRQRAGYY